MAKGFQKGHKFSPKVPWNKGLTKEIDRRIQLYGLKGGIARTGQKLSEETKAKMSKLRKGKPKSEEWKKKIGLANIHLKKFQGSGPKNANWKGGISFEPYSHEFNEKLKKQIKIRDNFTCQLCREFIPRFISKEKCLAIHHIDYNKKNNNPENLISLCNYCNSTVNKSREEWTTNFREKINEMIISSDEASKLMIKVN